MHTPNCISDPVPTDVTDEEFGAQPLRGRRRTARSNRSALQQRGDGRAASGSLDEIPLEEWQAVVDVNLTGVFLCTREAFGIMRRQRPQGGRIINNGSISAHTPRPQSIAYTATKHAITGPHQVDRSGRARRTTSPAARSISATRPPT